MHVLRTLKHSSHIGTLVLLLFHIPPTIADSKTTPIIWYGGYVVGETVDPEGLKKDVEQDDESYAGSYHFGYSEAESTVLVVPYGETLVIQERYGRFTSDENWEWACRLFENVRLEGNRFTSDSGGGEFVTYTYRSEEPSMKDEIITVRGLIIDNELGYKETDGLDGYPDWFTRELTEEDVQEKTKPELRIMRNEIFARYGYTFKAGGEMDTYFRQQRWYSPQASIEGCLTEIEKRNIRFIQEHE